MFQYYYDVILPRFGRRNVSILLSDTDSFIFHIKNYTKNEIRWKLGDVMDFSNIPAANKMCNATRKNVPGFLKDETPAGDIVECIALKSKCYALRTRMNVTGEIIEEKKCKGITKPTVKRIRINNYRSCVSSLKAVRANMTRISVKKRTIRTILQNKVCLSSFDDKRFMLNCGKHSLPYQKEPISNVCTICHLNV